MEELSKKELIEEAVKCGYPRVLCETAKNMTILKDLIKASKAVPPLETTPGDINLATGVVTEPEKKINSDFDSLPVKIKEYLLQNWGNWLNYFEVGWEEREDFVGGRAFYVKVPREFSTEWKEETHMVYDNSTRRIKVDEKGKEVTKVVITPDIRWKAMQDTPELIRWLNIVKEKTISDCYRAGIQLPNTNTAYEDNKKTLDDFKKSVHA